MIFFNKDHRTLYICPSFIKNGTRNIHFKGKDKYVSLVIIPEIKGGQMIYELFQNKELIKKDQAFNNSPIVIPLITDARYHLVINHTNHIGKVKIYLKKKRVIAK